MHPLDIDQFRAKREGTPRPTKRQQPSRYQAGEWFLKGPIPGAWLARAARLSFRALRAGLALWYLAGVRRTHVVKPTRDTWQRFGLSPDAARRGLTALEEAGLVDVDRHPGRCPVVTIRKMDGSPSHTALDIDQHTQPASDTPATANIAEPNAECAMKPGSPNMPEVRASGMMKPNDNGTAPTILLPTTDVEPESLIPNPIPNPSARSVK